jgi:hypothetical protein
MYGGLRGSNAPDVEVIFNHQFFVMGILPTGNFLIYHLRMGTRLGETGSGMTTQIPHCRLFRPSTYQWQSDRVHTIEKLTHHINRTAGCQRNGSAAGRTCGLLHSI